MNTTMKRHLCLSALGILCGVPTLLVLTSAEGQDRKGSAPAIIAQARCDGTLGTRVIRTASDAREILGNNDEDAASAQLAKMLKVVKIDWHNQMIIFVSGGVQPTSGYSVQIAKLSVAEKKLIVHWSLNLPGPGDGVLQVLTHPGQIVLCERFDGGVRFEQDARRPSNAEPRPRRLITTVVNFDGLDAQAKGVEGANLADYLARFGIKAEAVTPRTTLRVVDARTLYEGKAVVAASPHNLLSQFGSNDPVAFTLRFDPPLVKFEFTRPKLVAATADGVSHPGWVARAFDAQGEPLDAVGRDVIASRVDVPAAKFTLSGPGIAAVRFESKSWHFTGFSAVLLDDLVLTRRGRR